MRALELAGPEHPLETIRGKKKGNEGQIVRKVRAFVDGLRERKPPRLKTVNASPALYGSYCISLSHGPSLRQTRGKGGGERKGKKREKNEDFP